MEKQIENLKSPVPLAIIISSTIIAIALIINSSESNLKIQEKSPSYRAQEIATDSSILALEESVIPSGGVTIPVVWGAMGQNLIKAGVIKEDNFKSIYESRGGFTTEGQRLLLGTTTERLVLTRDNAGIILNLLWALGLSQKSPILENGEMANPKYGGAQNFASTGGWTLAQGNAMEHYSYHTFFSLTSEQQAMVDKVSRGIYRPCCDNPVHFPDCNHGLAMLGLLELMASQGASVREMWDAALVVNSYWFPDTYVTIAVYMKKRGIEWNEVDPAEVLSRDYSSSSGYAVIASRILEESQLPQRQRGGNGCGINTTQGAPSVRAETTRQQSGCAI